MDDDVEVEIYDAQKYKIVGTIVNVQTGKHLDPSIPIFLMLATDLKTPAAIADYFSKCNNINHIAEGSRIAREFMEWQIANPDKVHEPDRRV